MANVAIFSGIPKPARVKGLEVEALTFPAIAASLTWNGVARADTYKIMRNVDGGDFLLRGSKDTPGFVDDTIIAGPTYGYQIIASNDTDDAQPSATVYISIPVDAPPDAPTITATSTGTNSILLEVDLAGTGGSVTGVQVYRDDTDELIATLSDLEDLTFTHEPLASGTEYCYYAIAVGPGGSSPASVVDCATTDAGIVIPNTPTDLSIIPSSSSASWQWTDTADDEEFYHIEVAPDVAGAPGTYVEVAELVGHRTTYTSLGHTPGSTLWGRVYSSNAAGPSGFSNAVQFTLSTEVQPVLLFTPSRVAAAKAKYTGTAAQQAQAAEFEARLDIELSGTTSYGYQGSNLDKLGDVVLGYLIHKDTNPVRAAACADKGLGVLALIARGNIRGAYVTRAYLGRGDGVKTIWNLPYTDNILASDFKLFRSNKQVLTRKKAYNSNGTVYTPGKKQDPAYPFPVKISNTPDGPADWVQRVHTDRNPPTWTDGDWRYNWDEYDDYTVDWSGAQNEPADGDTYYVTIADYITQTQLAASQFTLDTVNGTVTTNTPITADQFLFCSYQYGTPTQGASTLGYQQTHHDMGGYANIYIDAGWVTRTLKYAMLAYDGLYNYPGFPSDLKAEVERLIRRWYDRAKSGAYNAGDVTANYGMGHLCFRAWAAVVLNNRGHTDGPALIAEHVQFRNDKVVPYMSPPANGKASGYGGYVMDGWGYGAGGSRHHIMAALAMRDGGHFVPTVEIAFANGMGRTLPHGQTRRSSVTYVGETRSGWQYAGGNVYFYPFPNVDKYVPVNAVAIADDAVAKAYLNHHIQDGTTQAKGWEDMLFRDPAAAATDWTTTEPLQYFVEGPGTIYGRKDWSYTKTWFSLTFHSVPINLNMQSSPARPGHLDLWRGNDDLLTDCACIAGIQTANNNSPTPLVALSKSACANLVILDTGGNTVQQYRFGISQGAYWSTTGVQVLNYEGTDDYVYAVGNLKNAYSKVAGDGGACTLNHRCFFYDRTLDVIVVFDRLTKKDAGYTTRLQWHCRGDITVSGDSFTYTATSGASKLYGTIVGPAAFTTTDDGQITIGSASQWSTSAGIVQIHRVSAVLVTPDVKNRYCTVLQPAAAVDSAYSVTRVGSTGGDWEGCIINGTLVVLFGDFAGPISTAGGKSYTVTTTGDARHFICDLTPDQQYTLSGDASGTPTASAEGVLSFMTTGSGSKTVTIT